MSIPGARILQQFEATEARGGAARHYLALAKPRLLPMVLLTALPTMLIAAGGWPPLRAMLATLLGTAMAAASANALNCLIERDRDALMARTRTRPLPAGLLAPRQALWFGVALAVIASALLWAATNALAAGVALAGILFYVFVYTLWLKPRTPLSTIIGGAAGAVAPLIADAAISGRVGPAGLCVFLVVFFWQPPHFWAIALYRKEEYAEAGFPMLPLVAGEASTRRRMLLFTLLLIPVTLAPAALGLLGGTYLLAALALGGWFVHAAVRVLRLGTKAAARRMFRVSLVYLFLLFLAMLADLALRA